MITSSLQAESTAALFGSRPLISWKAVFAGWLAGNAVMILLMGLGSAIGLQAVDLNNPGGSLRTLMIGGAIWTLISWAVSFYLAGLFAAWLAGHIDRAVGAAHGFSVWALATVFSAMIGLLGLAGTLKGEAESYAGGNEAFYTQESAGGSVFAGPGTSDTAALAAEERAELALQKAERGASKEALWLLFFANVIALTASVFGGSFGSRRLMTSYRRFELEHV